MTAPAVIGFGALNLDRIFKVSRTLADGETAIESAGSFPGGSAANTIYGLARLGIPTGFCGVVGDDDAARILLSDFEHAGVDASHIKIKPKTDTGNTLCITDKIRRSLYVAAGANGCLGAADVDVKYLSSCRWLHVSSFVGDEQFTLSLQLFATIPSFIKLSFAPGSLYVARGFEALLPALKRANVVFFNRPELELLSGTGFVEGAHKCVASGCETVVVTLGSGITKNSKEFAALISTKNSGDYWIKTGRFKPNRVVDTTGAGDAFSAGFLFGILLGMEAGACGEYGHTTAYLSIAGYGARAALPTESELIREHRRLYL
jgi:sugar/nucleoside kinase (ribokinase family)